MKLSTRARYGVRAMVDIARHSHGEALSVREIAEHQRLSVKYLEAIMAPLKASGLVRAVRGMKGGYQLTKSPKDVTIADVYSAIEGPILLVGCLENADVCEAAGICPTRDIWLEMNESLRKTLRRTTLADLVDKSVELTATTSETYSI